MTEKDLRDWLEHQAKRHDWAKQVLVTGDMLEERGQQLNLPVELYPDRLLWLLRWSKTFGRHGRVLKAHMVKRSYPVRWMMCGCGKEYEPGEVFVVRAEIVGRDLYHELGCSNICGTCERVHHKERRRVGQKVASSE